MYPFFLAVQSNIQKMWMGQGEQQSAAAPALSAKL
jgi:hypothetical protein